MSGPSQTQNQSTQQFGQSSQSGTVNPYAPATGLLSSAISAVGNQFGNASPTATESGAIGGLENNAGYTSQFTPQQTSLVNDLYSGGKDRTGIAQGAYDTYLSDIAPTASGKYLDPSTNPFFNQTVSTIGNDVTNRLKGLYAGAGVSAANSGNVGYNLARGISEGTAPTFANVYNTERTNQLNAQNNRYGAGNTTTGLLSGLDQTALGNRSAAAGAASTGQAISDSQFTNLLAAEAQKRGIPLSLLSALIPAATSLGGVGKTFDVTGAQSGQSQSQGETQKNYGTLDYLSALGGALK